MKAALALELSLRLIETLAPLVKELIDKLDDDEDTPSVDKVITKDIRD